MAGVGVAMMSTVLMTISPVLGGKYNGGCECGFDPSGVGHINFSVSYFLITIIFLIFDVEIAMLLPIMVTPLSSLFSIWGMVVFSFLLALILGTYYEWSKGALDWKY